MLGDTPRHTQTHPDIIRDHWVRDDRRVPEGTTGGMVVACRRARRPARRGGWSSRVVSLGAGSRAVSPVAGSRPVVSRPVSATSVSLPWSRSDILKARHLPCPGPTAACSRRRHRRFTNIYSFVWPWRFIVARSAARLRRIVGPLASRNAVPDRLRSQISPGITEHRPGITGHHRA